MPDTDDRKRIRATAAQARIAERLAEIKREAAELESEREELLGRLMKRMDQVDADVLEGDNFAFYKMVSTSTSWKQVAIDAGASGEMIAKHTAQGAPFLRASGALFK